MGSWMSDLREGAVMPKYQEVVVPLIGEDGSALVILAKVRRALHQAGVDQDEIETYVEEAMAGDYDNLLRTTMRWVEVV